MEERVTLGDQYEIHYVRLQQPFTTGVEYEVTIRLIRDECGRPTWGPATVFIAFGKTPDEGLRNAERLIQARLGNPQP